MSQVATPDHEFKFYSHSDHSAQLEDTYNSNIKATFYNSPSFDSTYGMRMDHTTNTYASLTPWEYGEDDYSIEIYFYLDSLSNTNTESYLLHFFSDNLTGYQTWIAHKKVNDFNILGGYLKSFRMWNFLVNTNYEFIKPGQFNHIVLTKQFYSSTNQVENIFYINGEKIDNDWPVDNGFTSSYWYVDSPPIKSVSSAINSANKLTRDYHLIGNYKETTDYGNSGYITYFRMWDSHALTDDEAYKLYQSSRNFIPNNLTLNYNDPIIIIVAFRTKFRVLILL